MPLSPFLSAESWSDREFQWQRASQGSETTGPGRCKSPGVGTGGQTELGWEGAMGGAGGGKSPVAAGERREAEGGEGDRFQGCSRLFVQGCTQCRFLCTTSPGVGPINFSIISLLLHLPPATPPLSISFPWALWSQGGWEAIWRYAGDGMLTALPCLQTLFGSRSSLPRGLNSTGQEGMGPNSGHHLTPTQVIRWERHGERHHAHTRVPGARGGCLSPSLL